MIKSHFNGHKIVWKNKNWYYVDGKSIKKKRHCPQCGELPTKKGHDACLSNLPGVQQACCGHGAEPGYIKFNDGRIIRFKLIEN